MTFLHATSLFIAFCACGTLGFVVACILIAIYAKRKGDYVAHGFLTDAGNMGGLVLIALSALYLLVFMIRICLGDL